MCSRKVKPIPPKVTQTQCTGLGLVGWNWGPCDDCMHHETDAVLLIVTDDCIVKQADDALR